METELRLRGLFERQRAAFAAQPFPSVMQRKTHLRALKSQLLRYQDELVAAISRDFGFRAPAETQMMDVLGSVLEINHALSHVGRWMRSRRRSTELLFMSNSLRVQYQPKGVVGVIVPWNFPVYLALGPLAAALAAGNRVLLKLSEATPATNEVLASLLAEAFSEEWVAVVGAELEDPNFFTALPFDHIVFTGSPAVGRAVMRTAAQNLTPVTLELGGKSPALLLPGCDPRDAANRIAHGKAVNAGQICIAPDYALVPQAQVVVESFRHGNRTQRPRSHVDERLRVELAHKDWISRADVSRNVVQSIDAAGSPPTGVPVGFRATRRGSDTGSRQGSVHSRQSVPEPANSKPPSLALLEID